MFSTLDASSLREVAAHRPQLTQKQSPPLVHKPGKKSRSKTGCYNCRHIRKKKCDEIHPVCGSCKSRGLDCVWTVQSFDPLSLGRQGVPEKKFVAMAVKNSQVSLFSTSPVGVSGESPFHPTFAREIRRPAEQIEQVEEVEDVDFGLDYEVADEHYMGLEHLDKHKKALDLELEDLDEKHLDELDLDLALVPMPFTPPVLYSAPSSLFNLYLDEQALHFLDLYKTQVCTLICVSDASSNYFLKTFLKLGASQQAVGHLLVAWGAVVGEGADSAIVQQHREIGLKKLKESILLKKSLDRFDYMVLLCFYLIETCREVFSGDTSNWYKAFTKVDRLFAEYGSIARFLTDFGFSNDAKFVVSNFQFHDILSSVTLREGTTCKITHYQNLFDPSTISGFDYGLDPYQGCIQPLYLILGDILNVSVHFKKVREEVAAKLHDLSESVLVDDDEVKNLNEMRVRLYVEVDVTYNDLLDKVNRCYPNEHQLKMLEGHPEELEGHLTLFELYRNTCKMYMLLYIRQTQPTSSEVQFLLLDLLKLIDAIINSKLKASLVMSLLVCGICCTNKLDRLDMRSKFNKLYVDYKVGNMKRALKIVEECWRLNPEGNKCIDWVEICEKLGWKLSLC